MLANSGYRTYIAISGRRNVGKSSLINSIFNQDISIVSEVAGTTTDPVYKSMELQPIGPVTIIDTPGIDDEGEIGIKRIERARKSFYKADIALLVTDSKPTQYETFLSNIFNEMKIPFIIVINKIDKIDNVEHIKQMYLENFKKPVVEVSCLERNNIEYLKQILTEIIPQENDIPMLPEFIKSKDIVLLVVPVDTGAPKGRLIMPQVNAIREILDRKAFPIVTSVEGLPEILDKINENPRLVITDSQAIKKVDELTPKNINLTTFSILEARHKGDINILTKDVEVVEKLENGDTILIIEGCSHRPLKEDIGRIKIPAWLEKYTKKSLNFKFISGKEFPELSDVKNIKLAIHCGGCTLTRKMMLRRINALTRLEIPVVNYGVIISYLHGVLNRTLEPLLI
ncbi:[FeFe] hydrogenase H-cluster maturation GTPase HydF [Petrotoga sp. 9PWA.NaAc.5.4]|uniref:[FeFe] hydrogenase H-cluster maturation GTPase HydF n=1 Tax=Petrotoga sp. 9PWA.NaAc.5.4 TaxID=1434328 RepID=UPI000CB653D7|nr:[FeFe] hydrogenase H-cluster maturation GTPase HydF [Petrotoga sp. 9PWA.NaAc.5.4]PNR95702.1 ATP-binding protein [Petrotoga sp. 9PWA.NaAc.5.4]